MYSTLVAVILLRLTATGVTIPPDRPGRLANAVIRSGYTNNVDPMLLLAVIETESQYKVGVTSSAGCKGPMQLDPRTARSIARAYYDIGNLEHNVEIGARYLRSLIVQHPRDLRLALTAYNIGPGALKKRPYPNNYSYKVLRILGRLRNIEHRLIRVVDIHIDSDSI